MIKTGHPSSSSLNPARPVTGRYCLDFLARYSHTELLASDRLCDTSYIMLHRIVSKVTMTKHSGEVVES